MQLYMLPFESHMQQLLLRVKDLYDENHGIALSSGGGVDVWPSDADLKRKTRPAQAAAPKAVPSSSVDVKRQQEQKQKREQVQQRQSHKEKQMREAREWLAQQQQQQPGNCSAASSSCLPCAAADLCTFWKVRESPLISSQTSSHSEHRIAALVLLAHSAPITRAPLLPPPPLRSHRLLLCPPKFRSILCRGASLLRLSSSRSVTKGTQLAHVTIGGRSSTRAACAGVYSRATSTPNT